MDRESKKEIAVVGSEEFTLGFRLAGVTEIHDRSEYEETIQELVSRDDLGIVIAESGDLEELPDRTRRKVEESVDPVVVPLSEKAESERLNEKIRTVIGADIT